MHSDFLGLGVISIAIIHERSTNHYILVLTTAPRSRSPLFLHMQRTATSMIPLDIFLYLVDAVADDNTHLRNSTLRACALTCSAWLGRPGFSCTTTFFLDGCGPMRKFSGAIAASSELGTFVSNSTSHLEASDSTQTTMRTKRGHSTHAPCATSPTCVLSTCMIRDPHTI